MEENFSPEVASFLIRIVQDQPHPEKAGGFPRAGPPYSN